MIEWPWLLLLRLVEELDVVPFAKGDDRLLPVRLLAVAAPHALDFAALYDRVHVRDLHVEHLFDAGADFSLVRVQRDLEHDLVLFLQTRSFFRQRDWALDDVFDSHDFLSRQRASRAFTAFCDRTKWSWRRRS